MATERIPVEPAVMIWARESVGLSEPSAARKLGVSEQTLSAWESGDLSPTIVQVRRASKEYKRPLAVLLLSEPPEDFSPLRDFRDIGDDSRPWSVNLHGEFRRAMAQRDVALEIFDALSLDRAEPSLPAIDQAADPEEAGADIRSFLGISFDAQLGFTTPHEALNAWVAATEARGIIVIHTARVSIEEARGFSISEWPYPVIALNGSDYPRGRIFTLLHELVHVAANLGGLCDLHESRSIVSHSGNEFEQFCNRVAASALMPEAMLIADPMTAEVDSSYEWTLDELTDRSRRVSVSSEALLLRLIAIGRASWDTYWKRKPEFQHEFEAAKERDRELQQSTKGGPSFYAVKARDLGHGYVASVLDAYQGGRISSRDVAEYLYIKFGQLSKLEATVN